MRILSHISVIWRDVVPISGHLEGWESISHDIWMDPLGVICNIAFEKWRQRLSDRGEKSLAICRKKDQRHQWESNQRSFELEFPTIPLDYGDARYDLWHGVSVNVHQNDGGSWAGFLIK